MPDLSVQRSRSPNVTVRMHIGTLAVMLMPNDQDSILTYVTVALDRHKSRLSREALALADRNYLGGSAAGNVFLTALQLRLYKVAKSVPTNKAIFVFAESQRKARLQSGRKAPSNFDTIRKFWDEYRSVAHLWAAYCLMKEDGSLPFQGEKQLTDREQATRCIDFLMCADCMLNTAEQLRFDFHADPWRVPASFPRRRATFPGIAPPDDWTRATLARYTPATSA